MIFESTELPETGSAYLISATKIRIRLPLDNVIQACNVVDFAYPSSDVYRATTEREAEAALQGVYFKDNVAKISLS